MKEIFEYLLFISASVLAVLFTAVDKIDWATLMICNAIYLEIHIKKNKES